LIQYIRSELSVVRDLVASGAIQDDTDIQSTILDASKVVVNRLNRNLLETEKGAQVEYVDVPSLSVGKKYGYIMQRPVAAPVKVRTITPLDVSAIN
jgi:pectin methylesterase-like acyl-CoA thioesterase